MSSEGKNLEVISKAIDRHDETCDYPAIEIRMNPFEVERLDWPEIKGIPIVGDENLPTGIFRIICDAIDETPIEEVEAIGMVTTV